MNLTTIIPLSILVIGQIVTIVISIRKPNEDQDVKLAGFNEQLKMLIEDTKLMKANHLPHIEGQINSINERLTRMETILEERLPKK